MARAGRSPRVQRDRDLASGQPAPIQDPMIQQLPRLAPLVALVLVLATPAFAGQSSDALPGVKGDYSIVTPAPEPMEAPTAPDDGTFKVGDWDVRISGSVSVEIGTGTSRQGGQQRR